MAGSLMPPRGLGWGRTGAHALIRCSGENSSTTEYTEEHRGKTASRTLWSEVDAAARLRVGTNRSTRSCPSVEEKILPPQGTRRSTEEKQLVVLYGGKFDAAARLGVGTNRSTRSCPSVAEKILPPQSTRRSTEEKIASRTFHSGWKCGPIRESSGVRDWL